ncbi:hypothetical protein D3C87_181400 [compost metagenome]
MKLTTTIYSIFLIGFSGLSQLSGTTSSQLNTNCNGIQCNYSGPSILINELMISPSNFDGSMSGPSSGNDPGRGEWIELYNPNICEPVDISCYYLGNYTETEGAGGFVIPTGTIIPPAGFCMVRGINVAPVPPNRLVQNGGNVVEVVVPGNVTAPGVCVGTGGAFRLWFPNAGGWFAFYDANGVPQDAVSWLGAGGANGQPCVPSSPGCTSVPSLLSYANIPANRKTLLNIAGGILQTDRSARRVTDGGAWGGQALPTYANCNATCIPAGASSCTGSATVSVSGGTPPYSYAWNDSQVQTTPTATGLCAGTYSVTVTDNVGATAVFQVTIENFVPTVSVSIQPEVCVNSPAVAITRSPVATAGQTGTLTGTGVSGSNFNPATAGVGNQAINYYFEDQFGCSNSANTSIIVNPVPVVSIANNQSPYCVAVDTAALVLSPVGGQLTGTGVSGNQFLPSTAGAGTYTLTYTYQDANGCSNSATVSVQVVNPVQPDLTLPSDLCIDADTLVMAGTPAGGNYQIDGVPSNNEFIAPNEGAGNHAITYQTTDANGCTASVSGSIIVHELPIVSVNIQPDICIDASPAAITISPVATPGQTGTLTGTGVNGTNFNPATAGTGSQTITYYFENELGCSNTATDIIMVNPLPVVSVSNNQSPYCVAVDTAALVLSPTGGQLTGTGVSSNQFMPAAAGAGTYTLTYSYQDANSCSNSATVSVQVVNPVQPALTLPPDLCIDADTLVMAGTPAGGNYQIDGVPSNNEFIAPNEGAGNHTVTYETTDSNGCTASVTDNILVHELPTVSVNVQPEICIDASPAAITVSPVAIAGQTGTLTGTGVSGTNFNPAIAGTGSQTITYYFENELGCSNTATDIIMVNPLPVVSISNNQSPYCIATTNANLILSPTGGQLTGTGVSNNQFSPSQAGVGTFTLTYLFQDTNGCSNSTTVTVQVVPPAPVTLTLPSDLCVDSDTVTMVANPGGGVFLIDGTPSSDQFIAPNEGAGIYSIGYSVTDNNGCIAAAIGTIVVHGLPALQIPVNPAYCFESGFHVVNPTPSGGTFTGDNVSGNGINLTGIDPGNYTVSYSYSDQFGCTNHRDETYLVTTPITPNYNYVTDCFQGAILGASVSNPNYTYHWNIENIYEGTGSIYSLLFAEPGNYQLDFTITDNYGCSYDTTGGITIEEGFKIENLSIANIITPNGDGINDQLILPDLMNDCFTYEILIVNRWGNLVFKMDGHENKVFDGRSKNGTELAEGVYFYQIQSDEIDCNDEKYKGFCYGNITIVR